MYFAGKFPAPVATALPAGHWPISLRIRSSSRMISGPPARWMAPSTPPPPASSEFAALTIASAATRVISPSRKATVCPDGLVHSTLSITIDERPHAKLTGHWRGRRRRRNRGARRQYLLHTARRAHRSERPCPQSAEGSTVADSDMGRLFDAVPLLGQKYNPTLIAREKIASHESEDRMVAARFEVPDDRLEARKRLVLRIEEVDGAVSEISE